MHEVPSSTWFTTAPHWQWLIVLYFFLGGIAGGTYLLGTLIDLFGRREDAPLARLGYYIAFIGVVLCGPLLIIDLGRPLRFWHMLIQRNTFEPMFKIWSPMSLGSWALLVFGIFSFLSLLGALAEDDRRTWLRGVRVPASARMLRPPGALGTIIAVLGGFAGLFLAGYTGVLLAVTNRPVWSDSPLLGMVFIVSAASTAAALMVLLANRWGWTMRGLADLRRMDDSVIALELVVLLAFLISLGPVLRAWANGWGVLMLIAIVVGVLAPLLMSLRARREGRAGRAHTFNYTVPAALVLAGGFLLRVVIVLSSGSV